MHIHTCNRFNFSWLMMHDAMFVSLCLALKNLGCHIFDQIKSFLLLGILRRVIYGGSLSCQVVWERNLIGGARFHLHLIGKVVSETTWTVCDVGPRPKGEGCALIQGVVEVGGSHQVHRRIIGDRPHGGRQLSVFYCHIYLGIPLGRWMFVGSRRDQEHDGASNTRV